MIMIEKTIGPIDFLFLQELKDENGRVYKLLSERDFELRQLKKKREEEKAALASKNSLLSFLLHL